jgi:hypothetical protein
MSSSELPIDLRSDNDLKALIDGVDLGSVSMMAVNLG